MKKTIAALGASALGLGSAVVVGSPAAATEFDLPKCENILEQFGGVSTPDSEVWFDTCVPQYGLGKAEFTIVPDENNPDVEFPAGFVPLDESIYEDSPITVTTTLDQAAISAYFGESVEGEFAAPITPTNLYDWTDSSQTYEAFVIAPITRIEYLEGGELPDGIIEACEIGDPDDAYGVVASYAPIDATFSQVVDGEDWSFTISAQAADSYFVFVEGEALGLCVTDGETVLNDDELGLGQVIMLLTVWPFIPEIFIDSAPVSLEQLIAEAQDSGISSALGTISPAASGVTGFYDLGVFSRDVAPAPGPALAATGADAASLILPAVIVGGIVILGGVLVTVSVLRKRKAAAVGSPVESGDADPTV